MTGILGITVPKQIIKFAGKHQMFVLIFQGSFYTEYLQRNASDVCVTVIKKTFISE